MSRKKLLPKKIELNQTIFPCSSKNNPAYDSAPKISLLKRPVAQAIKINISLIFRTLGVIEKEPHPFDFVSHIPQ